MDKYNRLLIRIADEYFVWKGKTENITRWKVRLIYCVLGRMALASLWDMDENGNVSIIHMKNFDYPEKTLKYKHIRRISD